MTVETCFIIHNDGIDEARKELYENLSWKLETVPLNSLGVWDNAQGIPHSWCIGNVEETAEHLKNNCDPCFDKPKTMAKTVRDLNLDTIIVVDGKLRRGRENCQLTRWSIDDGCMRALSYALRGYKEIQAYTGSIKS